MTQKEISRRYYLKNKQRVLDTNKSYYMKNKDIRNEKKSQWNVRWYHQTRDLILEMYGNKCCHCGFDDKRALQIDHINGGGSVERKGLSVNNYLKKVFDEPEKYQLLCANCNWIKRAENKETNKKWNK